MSTRDSSLRPPRQLATSLFKALDVPCGRSPPEDAKNATEVQIEWSPRSTERELTPLRDYRARFAIFYARQFTERSVRAGEREAEQAELISIARSRSITAALSQRARIVLARSAGDSNSPVARRFSTDQCNGGQMARTLREAPHRRTLR